MRPSATAGFTSAALACIAFSSATFFGARNACADPISISPEQAYDQGQIPEARAVAMGGALNALGVSTAALFMNPANMSLARVYHIEGLAAFQPESSRQTYGLAIVDSVLNTSHIAGGLGGTWSTFDPDGLDRSWTDVRGALSLPVLSFLSVGAAVRYLRIQQVVDAGPFGSSLASGGTPTSPIYNDFTFDLGATASLEGFRFGVVGHNLTNPGTGLVPTTAAAGLGYSNDKFALEGDGMLDFTTYASLRGRVMVGGEVFVAERYALRGGWRYDTGTKLNTPSIGLGYIDPKWSAEIAVNHDITDDHASTLIAISVRYFYDPTGSTSPADQADSF